jgi:hypothetical protein
MQPTVTTALPQIEWKMNDLHIQMTGWRKDAVTTYVWLGDSGEAIAGFRAESFERALELLKTDTAMMLANAIESLRTLELPSGLTTAST